MVKKYIIMRFNCIEYNIIILWKRVIFAFRLTFQTGALCGPHPCCIPYIVCWSVRVVICFDFGNSCAEERSHACTECLYSTPPSASWAGASNTPPSLASLSRLPSLHWDVDQLLSWSAVIESGSVGVRRGMFPVVWAGKPAESALMAALARGLQVYGCHRVPSMGEYRVR